MSVGPKSVSSSHGGSPAPSTPMVTSPVANLGKGMSTLERAALNAPRQNVSRSSQMAAITSCAQDKDDDSPQSAGAHAKGKIKYLFIIIKGRKKML